MRDRPGRDTSSSEIGGCYEVMEGSFFLVGDTSRMTSFTIFEMVFENVRFLSSSFLKI